MTTRSGKAELAQVLSFAEGMGYTIEERGSNYRVTAPGGEQAIVSSSPRGRELLNQKAKLKRIGVPLTKQEYQRRKARITAKQRAAETPQEALPSPAVPEVAAVSAPPAEPTPAITVASPSDDGPQPERDAPVPSATPRPPAPMPAFGFEPEPEPHDTPAPPPQPQAPAAQAVSGVPNLTELTEQAAYDSGDVGLLAYALWRRVRFSPDAKPGQVLMTEPGVAWRGQFKKLLRSMWPDLSEETRKHVYDYLVNLSGNMRCTRKYDNPPEWWAREEWNQPSEPGGRFTPVRAARRPAPRTTAGPPAPVTTRYIDPPKPPPPAAPAPVAAAPAPAPVAAQAGGDVELTPALVLAGVSALVEANRDLEADNAALTEKVAELRLKLASAKAELAELRRVVRR